MLFKLPTGFVEAEHCILLYYICPDNGGPQPTHNNYPLRGGKFTNWVRGTCCGRLASTLALCLEMNFCDLVCRKVECVGTVSFVAHRRPLPNFNRV